MTYALTAAELREERANAWTHGLGFALALAAVPFLLYTSATKAAIPQWWSLWVFCLSLLLVYGVSTLYHSVHQPGVKYICRIADHISIYFLIAGTHTPFLAYYPLGGMSKVYLYILWSLVAAGVLYKLFFFGRWEWLSVALYLAMGWMGVLTIPAMMEQMPASSLYGVIIGGLSYTIGVVFYAWHRLPYHHAIWHLFVIGGSLAHFWAIWAMASAG
ncbi:MAG: hemolysin III family protein [Phaeodactylibacter sp.]|nr:hemolysin III family protein [Phaeodactylibacter sp.]MCB9272589.1 hemolysin III family protein [Lewinellaceae bacterium]